MINEMTLLEFLKIIAQGGGEDIMDMVERFQCGELTIAGINAADFD